MDFSSIPSKQVTDELFESFYGSQTLHRQPTVYSVDTKKEKKIEIDGLMGFGATWRLSDLIFLIYLN